MHHALIESQADSNNNFHLSYYRGHQNHTINHFVGRGTKQ